MKTKLKIETMTPQNMSDTKKHKEKGEKREEARERKSEEKATAATARARACAYVREEATAERMEGGAQ